MPDSQILKYLSDSLDEEVVDLLDNFGYVSFSKDGSEQMPAKTVVNQGIKSFRAEYATSIVYQQSRPTLTKELTEFELDDLANLSDLEGRMRLRLYADHVKTDMILIRVLKFRLHILGLISGVNNQFDQELQDALKKLSSFLKVTSFLRLMDLLDDFDLLIEVAAKRKWNRGFRGLASVQFDGKSGLDREATDMKDGLDIINDTNTMSGTSVEFYGSGFVDKPWLTKKAREHLKVIQSHDFNRFVVRLIQIKLWLLGAYGHKIDGDMRLRSIEALEDFHELIASINTANQQLHVKPSRFLFRMKGGNWLINYKYLLLIGIPNVEKGFDTQELDTKAVSAQLEDLIEQAEAEKEGARNEILLKVDELVNEKLNSRSDRRKKKVRKAKGFMRQVIGFFKKAAQWIATGIQKVIDAISSFFRKVKNAVGYLIREIREAVNKTVETFSFFFSKRKISTNNLVTTDFDIDFDAVATLNKGYNSGILIEHKSKIDMLLNSMEQVFDVLQKTIPIVINLLKGPIGWVQLGIKLVKIVLKKGFDALFKPALSLR